MIKTFYQNGKLYSAKKVGSYTPPREKLLKITNEYVPPKHTSLFVKTLQEIIENNLEGYFVKLCEEANKLKKESLQVFISGDTKTSLILLQKSNEILNVVKSCKLQVLIAWMGRILIKYEDLTKQIVNRLPM